MGRTRPNQRAAGSTPPWTSPAELILEAGTATGIADATEADGRCFAREYYEGLSSNDQQKIDQVFVMMAEHGKIFNTRKFRHHVGEATCPDAGKTITLPIAEFKIDARRILAYRRECWWLLISVFDKGAVLKTEVERAGRFACHHLTTP